VVIKANKQTDRQVVKVVRNNVIQVGMVTNYSHMDFK